MIIEQRGDVRSTCLNLPYDMRWSNVAVATGSYCHIRAAEVAARGIDNPITRKPMAVPSLQKSRRQTALAIEASWSSVKPEAAKTAWIQPLNLTVGFIFPNLSVPSLALLKAMDRYTCRSVKRKRNVNIGRIGTIYRNVTHPAKNFTFDSNLSHI